MIPVRSGKIMKNRWFPHAIWFRVHIWNWKHQSCALNRHILRRRPCHHDAQGSHATHGPAIKHQRTGLWNHKILDSISVYQYVYIYIYIYTYVYGLSSMDKDIFPTRLKHFGILPISLWYSDPLRLGACLKLKTLRKAGSRNANVFPLP